VKLYLFSPMQHHSVALKYGQGQLYLPFPVKYFHVNKHQILVYGTMDTSWTEVFKVSH